MRVRSWSLAAFSVAALSGSHRVIYVLDRDGNQVQHWAQHDQLFDTRCGRGP